MQLHPRESFVITRQLQDPYITGTFYVRAVIRNSKTDTILETLDLVDQGSQRFTKSWLVPTDASGQGFYVSIITSVYTDSGYTTKSENYGDEENTYLVQERYVFNPNYPVGADVDYKRIQKMIDTAVKSILNKPQESKVVTVTKEVIKEVKVPDVRIVEAFKEPDLSSVLSAIKAVGKKVDDKPVTEVPPQKEVDLKPLINSMEVLAKTVDKKVGIVEKKMDSLKVKVEIKGAEAEAAPQKVREGIDDPRIKSLIQLK